MTDGVWTIAFIVGINRNSCSLLNKVLFWAPTVFIDSDYYGLELLI